ncbi:thioredoxin [Candidatus Pacearchaeota archaeon CG10_big_fil_rev_8_21_14_0_10_35_219]|nr:thioredoxin [Candidatus Pacearchaeota archaeon]OIO43064.1 MAG: thioredoxin [Candidatus Pacearchaeota archaeon CG1_02_35_32]PIO08189.1 MAG: thioredoxin [Candidatus Pacearchaeota archaeon CG10_big_fil_rev_8_21_14_0_10_35_219]PIY81121.1 MAG: thioredoxin [Candidatus Pacearchaeota archaeon CG_4_10_14_0_8_um_filter_35_169]PIZ79770.1 MAG: thioredoxin [Candidatus Pacearchaeota archaeon CG_4_10_14_0_2_um_filter_35_33]PJA70168.1 MAG: thioredoxin [Candidatus Pacearchaeota archaeon CG_4_9_14_3_um_filte
MAVKDLNKESFDGFVKKGAVVDFYADWCGPCKIMKPHFEKASESIKDVKFGKVNVDGNQELAQRFQVMSIPTTILFKDGKQVDRHSGALNEDMIKEMVDKAFK